MTKLLLVDDNGQNLYMLQALFGGHGYTVTVAQHGAEALRKAEQTPPDLIITDILMPVMDGFTLCRQWKASDKLRQIPFIFYTATYTDPKDEAFAFSLGADAFLVKPMEPEMLLRTISEFIQATPKDGNVATAVPDLEEDEVYKLYSERLVQKLEQKMLQLEQEIQERKQAEAAMQTSNQLLLQALDELKEIQEKIVRQERLAAIGQLATGIAHDINNILSVISLYTELMLHRNKLVEPEMQRLQLILHQTRQAAHLIQQVLDFARRTNLDRSATDLAQTLQEMVELLKRTLPENVQIRLEIQPGEHVVHVDRARIEQVVMNLALNARDAMPNGGTMTIQLAQVHLSAGNTPSLPELPGGDWVVITVTDDGEGIPENIRPRLFEPFFTTKPPGKGTGLGLAQVYGIVRQHEGDVEVKSKVGDGTTFKIYLPATPSAHVEGVKVGQETVPFGQNEVILLVEDNEATRQAILTSLESLNYRPLATANGKEALRVLAQHPEIALILSDVHMPELSGISLAKALADVAVPVILMTGQPEEELETLKLQGTIATWLNKPLNLNQLAQAVALGLAPNF